jgi:hypothetical protein
MQETDLMQWIDKHSSEGWYWYVKRLSGNDTLLNRTHQAGIYIPLSVVDVFAPSIRQPILKNPRKMFEISIDSHLLERIPARVIWYNNRITDSGTRNEGRITNWGGSSSPILDPDSTGSIFILAFHAEKYHDADEVHVWLCIDIEQEDIVEDRIGPVEPGERIFLAHTVNGTVPEITYDTVQKPVSCVLNVSEIPEEWLHVFPSSIEIVQKSISLRPANGKSPDNRLMERKSCEYDIFQSIENQFVLPRISQGFATVEDFLGLANSVANRRKSRAGHSLELQTRAVFDEENIKYSHGEVSELNKKPDFLFPSVDVYRESSSNTNNLVMLAVKTTCKDRWRQILNEADKIQVKHLLTIQEGVSENQFKEMQAAGVVLVVPEPLHKKFVSSIRPYLLTLQNFLDKLRSLEG